MKLIAPLVLILFLVYAGWAQNIKESPIGTWTNEEKEARFEIYKCGENLCGKIIWLKEPTLNGKPKVDSKNPDERLHNRPIMGMVFLKDFVQEDEKKWDNGTIYDPKSGKTYSCYMKLIGKEQMEVKGYIGISLVGRSQLWTRVY
jgi:uncharacterized protein (DUF2147 family)